MPTYRGAEHGDVDGPPVCSLALGCGGSGSTAECGSAGHVPWVGVHSDEDAQRFQGEHQNSNARLQHFQLGGPEKLTGADDPRHALQECGGLTDFCYLDDGATLCHPELVISCVAACDVAKTQIGSERNRQKTGVMYYVQDLEQR